jgi:regulator of chromosome condensation
MKISGLSNIVEVVCGASFNLAKSTDGKAYSWGIGECGELGRFVTPLKSGTGEDANYDLPNILKHHITPGAMYLALPGDKDTDWTNNNNNNNDISKRVAIKDVKSIGCGAYHSMVSVVGDFVYACGLNNYGQLGTGNTTNAQYLVHVQALDGRAIVSMCGGMHHTLALSSAGRLLAFGRGDSSQLGSSEVAMSAAGDYSTKPVTPNLPAGTVVVSMACGGNHNLVLTDQNEVYTWGYGDMLALGHGDEKDEKLPKKLNFTKAKIKNISITQVPFFVVLIMLLCALNTFLTLSLWCDGGRLRGVDNTLRLSVRSLCKTVSMDNEWLDGWLEISEF